VRNNSAAFYILLLRTINNLKM